MRLQTPPQVKNLRSCWVSRIFYHNWIHIQILKKIQGTISSAGMLCNPPPPKEKSWNHFLRPESCKKKHGSESFRFCATLLNWKGKSSHQFFATSYAWRFHSPLVIVIWQESGLLVFDKGLKYGGPAPDRNIHLAKWLYFTNLGFPEIRGFPLLNHHLGWGRVRSL